MRVPPAPALLGGLVGVVTSRLCRDCFLGAGDGGENGLVLEEFLWEGDADRTLWWCGHGVL